VARGPSDASVTTGPSRFATPVVRITREQHERMVAHCYFAYPNEACGLLAGPVGLPPRAGSSVAGLAESEPVGLVTEVYPARNAAESSRVYTVDSQDQLRAMRDAEARGVEIVGCWHSHTHTDPYPSPTDIEQAQWYPTWLYLLVSLRDEVPTMRAYRIRDGAVGECQIAVVG